MTPKFQQQKFPLGQVVMTPGISHLPAIIVLDALRRHSEGDWGKVDSEDQVLNDQAMSDGGRLFSAYPIDRNAPCAGHGANTFWIITEWDRSVTTILLPEEY